MFNSLLLEYKFPYLRIELEWTFGNCIILFKLIRKLISFEVLRIKNLSNLTPLNGKFAFIEQITYIYIQKI